MQITDFREILPCSLSIAIRCGRSKCSSSPELHTQSKELSPNGSSPVASAWMPATANARSFEQSCVNDKFSLFKSSVETRLPDCASHIEISPVPLPISSTLSPTLVKRTIACPHSEIMLCCRRCRRSFRSALLIKYHAMRFAKRRTFCPCQATIIPSDACLRS